MLGPPIGRQAGIYLEDVKMRFLMACSFSALPSLPKTSTLRQNLILALCHSISGHLFAVIASVLCAVTLLLVRRLGRENNIYTLFFYLCLTGTLASLGPLLMQALPVMPMHTDSWVGIAAVAVFSIGAQLSINQALVRIPAQKVSVMMTAEVPLVTGFGVLFLGEPSGWRMIVGALLIFGSGIGLNLLPDKSTSNYSNCLKRF